MDVYKQIMPIINEFLLPQEYKMEYVKYCKTVSLHCIGHLSQQYTVTIHRSRKLCKSMHQVIKIHVHAWERITMRLFTAD